MLYEIVSILVFPIILIVTLFFMKRDKMKLSSHKNIDFTELLLAILISLCLCHLWPVILPGAILFFLCRSWLPKIDKALEKLITLLDKDEE